MTAGTANSTMNENTIIDHTNTGSRFSVMPGRAQLGDRDEEVDRADRRRDADEHDAEAPEVEVDARARTPGR